MQATSSSGNRTYYDFDSSNAINGTYHMTLPDGPGGLTRLQINSNFDISFVPPSFSGTWESFRFTEVEGSNIVTIRKRNASGFGLDGGNGAANAQNVYLWNHNPNNVNQQWEEIDRGGGFFSYQKAGTNHSIDGGNGGSTGQNVYIWQTSPTNFNQHWRKVQITGNIYLLQKRNAAGFALDGGKGGATGQNVYMWTTNTGNQNQHWIFE